MNIALFDMDDSLADYTNTLVKDLETLRSPDEEVIAAENVWHLADVPHIAARIKLIKKQPNWWFNLPPIFHGMAVLERAANIGFDVHILTKGPKSNSSAWQQKLDWCHTHIANDSNVHITCDKGMVYGKVLYDDFPDYMLAWLKHRPRGLGIMPVTPSNKNFKHPNVIRYRGPDDFSKVLNALKTAYERKNGEELNLEEK